MPDKNALRVSANGSLFQQAYDHIRMAILKGELPLGSSVSRRKLASQLGMSVPPVTEALQRLETDGLVESRPRSGTTVRIPTSEDIRGHYVVREALESQAARLFAEKASQQERTELLAMAERLDAMYRDPNQPMYETFSFHERLHHRIGQCTGCPGLVTAIEKNHILVLNWHYTSAAHYSDLPEHWHRDLVRILIDEDAEAVDRAMREHVRYGLVEILLRLEAANCLADAPLAVPAPAAMSGAQN